jgi:L-malate glycosyltransferase
MKICLLAGASSIHTIRWVNALSERGHEVHLITMHRPKLDHVHKEVALHLLKVPAPIGYYVNGFEVKKLLRQIKPDFLHVHYASGYGTLSRFVAFEPTLLSVWGSDVYLFPYQRKQNEKILRKNLRAANHITSTSVAMKHQTELFISPKEPIDVVPFGIDLTMFKPSSEPENQTSITIGTIKSLKPIYGIDLLIEATAMLLKRLREDGLTDIADQIRLMIVGDGLERGNLEQKCKDFGIDSITTFVGAVPNEQVPTYLNQLDIYCAFSRSESFGVAVVEASACEVPVIVSNVGGLPEVVEDGKTGYVVDTKNMEAVVDKMEQLVKDRETRTQFGKQGREFVEQYYDWQENVTQMEQVYRRLLDHDIRTS